MARLGAAWEASEERPGGARGASGRRPGAARKASTLCSKGLCGKTGPRIHNSGDPVRSCLTCSARTVNSPSVFGEFCGGALSAAGVMDFHYCTQPLSLCRKSNTAAIVHAPWRRPVQQDVRCVCGLVWKCALSTCVCSQRQRDSSRSQIWRIPGTFSSMH